MQSKIDKAKHITAGKTMTTVLSEQVIAQLMSGVTPEGVTSSVEPEATTPAATETVLEATLETGGVSDTLTNYLQDKVSTLETKLVDLALRAEKAEMKLAEASGLDDLLRPIVVEATQRLQVALGQAPNSYADVPSRALAASYRATLEEFEKRFKPGRRSLQAQDDTRQPMSLAELRLVSSAR
jgi:hypothetical protein